MKALDIYTTRKDELVEKTIALLSTALNGDRGYRTFFFKFDEKTAELTVDYHYCFDRIVTSDNCFYTIKAADTPNFEKFNYKSFAEMDFGACGYPLRITNAIDEKIALIKKECGEYL